MPIPWTSWMSHVIDMKMVDGNRLAMMQKFVKIAVTEPEIVQMPFMLDAPSSRSCWLV